MPRVFASPGTSSSLTLPFCRTRAQSSSDDVNGTLTPRSENVFCASRTEDGVAFIELPMRAPNAHGAYARAPRGSAARCAGRTHRVLPAGTTGGSILGVAGGAHRLRCRKAHMCNAQRDL